MSYAKTLPPFLPSLYKRTRLINLLDQYRDHPAIWVQGQAGAGKTSLVAGYLHHREVNYLWYRMDSGDNDPATFFHYLSLAAEGMLPAQHRPLLKIPPESLPNLSPFARIFFREMFEQLPKPLLLVFDNVHALAPGSPTNQILSIAAKEIPPGVNGVFISRSKPPASMSRMRINRTLALMDQKQLRLTNEEAISLFRHGSHRQSEPETILRMNDLVDGWIAGFVLLLEHGGYDDPSITLENDYFFHYFASETVNTLDEKRRLFLLQTACLNSISATVASELTGMPDAQDILDDLCERHHFTTKSNQSEPYFQYHPLFRDFLLKRGKNEYGAQGYLQITNKAARILASIGQTEDAIELVRTTEDWPFLCSLIDRQAPVMLTQQRLGQLAQWLTDLPSEIMDSSPWLHYWLGCCRLPFAPRESRVQFEQAYTGFQSLDAPEGKLLSVSGVVIAIMTEWDNFNLLDPWIALLDEMVGKIDDYPSASTEAAVTLAMLGSLLFHMPQHPKMGFWEAKAERVIRNDMIDISTRMDTGNVLVHWQYWKGDLAAAAHTMDVLAQLTAAGGSSTLPRLMRAMNHAILDWHTAEFDQCLENIQSGLTLAEEMGIHILDDRLIAQSIFACLSLEDLPAAQKYLDRMKPNTTARGRLVTSLYYYLASVFHFIKGDLETARQNGQIAVDLNREVGTPYPGALAGMTLAQIHFDMGDTEKAQKLLADAYRQGRTMGSRTLALLYELTSAWFNLRQGKDEAMLPHLARGLALQKKMSFLNFSGWRAGMMKPLLLKALEKNIEPDFVKKLVRKRNLRLDAGLEACEKWPWPVKLYTLGKFSLLINDQPLPLKGKTKQKPLEFLKVLISLGGKGVSKDRLIDLLWPDTDGDKAAQALDTTLHRFRKLVGNERIIEVQDRKISLNPELCWVDVWALEKLLTRSEALLSRASPENGRILHLQQQIIDLHRGCFLDDDPGPNAILGYRKRLQDRYLNRLGLLGGYWEKQKDWNQAILLYQRLLEADEPREYFYQRLIACYHHKGLVAEAIKTYERCRETLFTHYSLAPSAETESLYRDLRQRSSENGRVSRYLESH